MKYLSLVLAGVLLMSQPLKAEEGGAEVDPLGILNEDDGGDLNSLPLDEDLDLDKPNSTALKKPAPEIPSVPPPEIAIPLEPTPPQPVPPISPPVSANPTVNLPVEKTETPPPPLAPPLPPVPSQAFDEAPRDRRSLRIERRLHEIYKKYNSQPTNVEAWDQAVGSRESETYKVQKGDTLWDLSEAFFGDPTFWPKIWSLNKKTILNPHQVDPSMTIQFFPGSLGDAPTLGILTIEKANEPYQNPDNMAVIEPSSGTGFSRNSKTILARPVGKIPPSLPIYRMGQVHKPPIDLQFDYHLGVKETLVFPIPYMLMDQAPKAGGKIEETELGQSSAGAYQYVFVRLTDGTPRVMTALKELKNLNGGSLLEVQGEIQVMERVSERHNLYRALVLNTLGLVQVGALLMDGRMATYDLIPGSDFKPSQPIRILSGGFGETQGMLGKGSFLFLGSGKNLGIQVGNILPVFQNQAARVKETNIEILPGVIGKIKVIAVDENFATGILIETKEAVLRGDWVGAPGFSTIPEALSPAPASPSPGSPSVSNAKPSIDSELDIDFETDIQGDSEVLTE